VISEIVDSTFLLIKVQEVHWTLSIPITPQSRAKQYTSLNLLSMILTIAIQIAFTLVPLLLGIISAAAATQSPSTSSPTISKSSSSSSALGSQVTGSSSVLRPTQSEIVPYNLPYTIQWTPPDIPGSISIELWDNDDWSWASSFEMGSNITVACDGWLENSQCSKIASRVPNSGTHGLSTPFLGYPINVNGRPCDMCMLTFIADLYGRRTVWNVISSLPNGTLGGKSYYYLGIYIQQSDDSLLPNQNASWYVYSGTFVIQQLSSSFATAPSPISVTYNGPTSTSSADAGGGRAKDPLGWGVLGLIGVLAMR
jgi:hypothetical protein